MRRHLHLSPQKRFSHSLAQRRPLLALTEEILAHFTHFSSAAISISTFEGRYLDVNDGFLRMFYCTAEEIIGHSAAELQIWADPAQRERMVALLTTPDGFHNQEIDFRRPNGSLVTGLLSVEVVTFAGLRCLLGMMVDITARKKVEEELRASEQRLREIIENSPYAVAVLDMELCYLMASEQYRRDYQLEGVQIIGRHYVTVIPETPQRWCEACQRALRGEAADLEEDWLQWADGGMEYVRWSCRPWFTVGGRVGGVLVFSELITERKLRQQDAEIMTQISAALRGAANTREMPGVILEQVNAVLKPDAAGLLMRDPQWPGSYILETAGLWRDYDNQHPDIDQLTGGFNLVPPEPVRYSHLHGVEELQDNLLTLHLNSVAGAPLDVRGEPQFGALWIGRCANEVSARDLHILTLMANIATNAIQRASSREQLDRYVQQLAVASEIGQVLGGLFDLKQIYIGLSRAVLKMLPDISTIFISRYDPRKQLISCVYAYHENEVLDVTNFPPMPLEPPGRGTQSEVIHSMRPVILNDLQSRLQKVSRVMYVGRTSEEGNTQSAVYAPMVVNGRVLGVVQAQSLRLNRFQPTDMEVLVLVANTAAIALQNADLFENLQQAHSDLSSAYDATIEGWGRALELRDSGTHGHTNRVADLAVALAHRMGISEEEMVHIRRGALLHDIGKMGVPDRILLKPGPLDSEEWEIMRQHPQYAYEMLAPVSYLRAALDIPHWHHERWDGTGYPDGLRGEAIPLAARVFAVIDVWDAITSTRPYSLPWPRDKALGYIAAQAGKQFDPQVAAAFIDLMKQIDW